MTTYEVSAKMYCFDLFTNYWWLYLNDQGVISFYFWSFSSNYRGQGSMAGKYGGKLFKRNCLQMVNFEMSLYLTRHNSFLRSTTCACFVTRQRGSGESLHSRKVCPQRLLPSEEIQQQVQSSCRKKVLPRSGQEPAEDQLTYQPITAN